MWWGLRHAGKGRLRAGASSWGLRPDPLRAASRDEKACREMPRPGGSVAGRWRCPETTAAASLPRSQPHSGCHQLVTRGCQQQGGSSGSWTPAWVARASPDFQIEEQLLGNSVGWTPATPQGQGPGQGRGRGRALFPQSPRGAGQQAEGHPLERERQLRFRRPSTVGPRQFPHS